MPQNSREFFFFHVLEILLGHLVPNSSLFDGIDHPRYPCFPAFQCSAAGITQHPGSILFIPVVLRTTEEGVRRHYRFFRRRPLLLLFSLYHSVLQCKSRKNVAVSKSPSFEHRFNFPFIFVGRGLGRGHWH